MFGRRHALQSVALSLAILALPAAAVQRTFVASYGNDANTASNCGFTNPCRGFTAAQTVTDSGGEIIALDAAGYGAITIVKSLTINANPGAYAGISASTGAAVTIGTAGVNVTLRGLVLNGIGATTGVIMSNGSRLSIENCVIANFAGAGVQVTGPITVRIVDTLIRESNFAVYLQDGPTATLSGLKLYGNSNRGVYVRTSVASVTTAVALSDSVISGSIAGVEVGAAVAGAITNVNIAGTTFMNNSYGLAVDGSPGAQTGTIGTSLLTGNTYGLYAFTGGTLESLGNNNVRQNGTNTVGTITFVSGN